MTAYTNRNGVEVEFSDDDIEKLIDCKWWDISSEDEAIVVLAKEVKELRSTVRQTYISLMMNDRHMALAQLDLVMKRERPT